jgi:hypothetical protein
MSGVNLPENGIPGNLPVLLPHRRGSYRKCDFSGSGIDYCALRLPNAATMMEITASKVAGMVSYGPVSQVCGSFEIK